MAYKQPSQNLSYVDRVLQRTREIARIQTGKASETPGNPEYVSVQEDEGTVNGGNPQSFNPEIVMTGNSDAQSNNVSVTLAQGRTSGTDVHDLWENISNMESEQRKFESEQTDLLSNTVLNVAKMQRQLEKTITSESVGTFAVGNNMTSPERSVNEDDMSDIFNLGVDSTEVNFLTDFDGLYEENQKFGPNVDNKLAELLDRAIDKPMPEDKNKELSVKYLVPGNCKRLEVPVVNQEIWTALKDKQEGHLAMQAIQKHLNMALEIYKNKGDQTQIPQLLKDGFIILANGIYHCNRKKKALIKPGIPAKYRKVCDLDIPITENLLGDDIDSPVDEIERKEKRLKKLVGVGSGHFLYQRPAQKGRGSLSDKRMYMERDRNQPFIKGQKYGQGRFKGRSYGGKLQLSHTREKGPINCK